MLGMTTAFMGGMGKDKIKPAVSAEMRRAARGSCEPQPWCDLFLQTHVTARVATARKPHKIMRLKLKAFRSIISHNIREEIQIAGTGGEYEKQTVDSLGASGADGGDIDSDYIGSEWRA